MKTSVKKLLIPKYLDKQTMLSDSGSLSVQVYSLCTSHLPAYKNQIGYFYL